MSDEVGPDDLIASVRARIADPAARDWLGASPVRLRVGRRSARWIHGSVRGEEPEMPSCDR